MAAKKSEGAAAKKTAAPGRAPRKTAAKQEPEPTPPADRPAPPRFAVIGTGRSGTGYMARLLRVNGVECGHENWFRADGEDNRTSGLDGDSSWLALPSIETRAWSGPVAHVVRHPLAVVRSLLGTRFFHPESAAAPWPAFARTHLPEVDGLEPLEAAVEWWVQWNERCATVADVKLRVEDLRKPWAVAELSAALGLELDPDSARKVPPTVNHKQRAAVDDTQVWRLLGGRASRFGYRR